LLRSYLALRGRDAVSVPADIQALIASVYDDPAAPAPVEDAALARLLEDTCEQMLEEMDREAFQARKSLIAWPDDEDVLSAGNLQLDEDNPELHDTWRALTRLARPSVTLVCLHRQQDGITLDPEGQEPVDLTAVPDRKMVEDLVGQSVAVSSYPVVKHFLAQQPPAGWRDHAMLRYYRAAIFDEGRCICGDSQLILDPHQGLIIERRARE
jgi:CRISPR-associated endonuclease/helicase Cas3